MKKCNGFLFIITLIINILLLVPFASRAQINKDVLIGRQWDKFILISIYRIQDRLDCLDTIEQMALREKDAYHLFRARYERADIVWRNSRMTLKELVLYLDSLCRNNEAAQWNDPDSLLYRSLYHYLEGVFLQNGSAAMRQKSDIRNTNYQQMEEWTSTDYWEAAKTHYHACFDSMPDDVYLSSGKWNFMINSLLRERELRPTLCDLLTQDCIERMHSDTTELLYLINNAISRQDPYFDRNIQIDYELLWLSYSQELPDCPVEGSEYWKAVDQLEAIYGQDEAFDFTRGMLLYAASRQPDASGECGARAIEWFRKVQTEGKIRYYRKNASYFLELLTIPSVELFDSRVDQTPAHKIRIPLEYSNIDTLYVSVFPTKYVGYSNMENVSSEKYGKSRKLKLPSAEKCVHAQCFVLENRHNGDLNTTEVWLDSLPRGNYRCYFHLAPALDSAGLLMSTDIRVTRLKVSNWTLNNKGYVAVNDRATGEPIPMRRACYMWPWWTNRFGEYRFTNNIGPIQYFGEMTIHDGKLRAEYMPDDIFGGRYSRYYRVSRVATELFTDRTMYRPGQTLYFKVLSMNTRKGKVKAGTPILVQLKDKDYRVVDTLLLTTSEFGTVEGQFKLPSNIGKYSLYVYYPKKVVQKNGQRSYVWNYRRGYSDYCRIEVAEYKLPTFKVKLLEDSTQVALGDTLIIRGTAIALNGQPLYGADVVLNIREKGGSTRYQLNTDRQGMFEYRHPVMKTPPGYTLDFEALVTDLNGETHRAYKLANLSSSLLTIIVEGENDYDLALRDTAAFHIRAMNFCNVPQETPLKVSVVRLQPPTDYLIPCFKETPKNWRPIYSETESARQFPYLTIQSDYNEAKTWPVADTLFRTERTFLTDSLFVDIKSWGTGNYKIVAEGVDKSGKQVSQYRIFTVNRSGNGRFETYQPIRVAIVEMPEETGKPITVSVGSVLHNAVMICDFYQGKRRLKTLRIPLDREQKTVTVKTRKSGKRDLNICARIVQNGKLHSVTQGVLIPMAKKDMEKRLKMFKDNLMKMELTHYHDVAEPGSEEQWELTLQNGHDNPEKNVEVLAWMIDCSLFELGMSVPNIGWMNYSVRNRFPNRRSVAFLHNIWCLDLSNDYSRYTLYREKSSASPITQRYEDMRQFQPQVVMDESIREVVVAYEPPLFSEDRTPRSDISEILASHDGVSSVDGTITSVRGNRSNGTVTIVDGMRVRGGSGMAVTEIPSGARPPESQDGNLPSVSNVRVRSHFAETAFFYPQLSTDEQGRVKLRFTVPDQYTQWQLFAVGHTKEMRMSSLTAYLKSRRTLMLQTNAPRFLREGDTMDFAAKLVNTGEQMARGQVTLEFANAVDNQPFELAAGASAEVHFRIVVPEGVPAVNYRIVARCTEPATVAGDGEENILPVLPNRMLVTESCPFVVLANTDTAFTFSRFRTYSTPTMQPLSYTMEVTTNPTWLAIQALPSLMRYPYDCNEQIFSKLFAAATVQHAIKQNPGLREVFQSWLADTVNDALSSPLMRNESLKSLLLEETPWMSAAQNESKRQRETAELFSADHLDQQINRNLTKLLRNQLNGGGWSWYGTYGYSRYITDHLIAGFYKLQRMGVEVPMTDKMLKEAIQKSDKVHEEDYYNFLEELKKNPDHRTFLTEEDVHYLYARTFAGLDSVWLSEPYVQHLMTLMMVDVYKSNYTHMAEVALILYRTGRVEQAKDIMETIRQQAFTDREKGMYWRKEYKGCYYRWYEAPIERQALLIEAFAEISPRDEELTAMKQWLLMQKEGNSWKSTKATAEAVYALLLGAPKDLLSPATTVVTVGKERFAPAEDPQSEAGTGYLQQVWNREDISQELADITVRTDSQHPAFGACYWQYLEVPDRVEAAGSGLSVRRTLYHAASEGDGKVAEPVTDDNPVRLGEKLTVRLVITSDRDLEYVHVKSPRAAAFEPMNIHERDSWRNGVRLVVSPRDAATNLFFERFPEGTIIVEYDVFATQTGDFSCGAATAECMYAPEYRAQSSGLRVRVR